MSGQNGAVRRSERDFRGLNGCDQREQTFRGLIAYFVTDFCPLWRVLTFERSDFRTDASVARCKGGHYPRFPQESGTELDSFFN